MKTKQTERQQVQNQFFQANYWSSLKYDSQQSAVLITVWQTNGVLHTAQRIPSQITTKNYYEDSEFRDFNIISKDNIFIYWFFTDVPTTVLGRGRVRYIG